MTKPKLNKENMNWKDKFPKENRYYEADGGILYNGNSIEVLEKMEENSVDTVITDPPYGLSNISEKKIRETMMKWLSGEDDYIPGGSGFMGKDWDAFVPPPALWREVYRVLKPGGTALVFAGTRTQDLMSMSLRLAGFEIKDTILWIYGSGFPKSLNIAKNIRKQLENMYNEYKEDMYLRHKKLKNVNIADKIFQKNQIEVGNNIVKNDWEGYGTALKPAFEPIILAIKSPEGGYAQNALKWGVAGLNIDGGRIGTNEKLSIGSGKVGYGSNLDGKNKGEQHPQGRFPANIILECICDEVIEGTEEIKEPEEVKGGIWRKSEGKPAGRTYKGGYRIHTNPECPCYMLDEQSGELGLSSGGGNGNAVSIFGTDTSKNREKGRVGFGDKGGASRYFKQIKVDLTGKGENNARFFYCAKASKKERGVGNTHPTVKSLKLMEYLCTLTKTPAGGIVLDPFGGSGTTAIACKNVGRQWILIELHEKYCEIAKQRIKDTIKELKEVK